MKYYIIAGEASGDLHASNLMKALKKQDKQAEFRFWGGDLMQAQGGVLVKHYRELAFMGFVEVLLNIRTILGNIKLAKKDILDYKPDVLILIDYPGFNMRIATFAKQQGIPVHYYISPQIWAWKENRIHKIKRDVTEMYVILPFEKEFYEQKHQFPVHYVGHPLLDELTNRKGNPNFKKEYNLLDKPIIALLPGSRTQEIEKMLAVMLQMVPKFPEYQFVIAGAPSQEQSFYENISKNHKVKIIKNQTHDLLANAAFALVTSGTATLETALFRVPQVVCYKGSFISYEIGKRLIDLKYISLVNLIMDKEIVKELIQHEFNKKTLFHELKKIQIPENKAKMLTEYDALITKLGGGGASKKVATLIVKK
jgi:lipid-A-disaccharide synthase